MTGRKGLRDWSPFAIAMLLAGSVGPIALASGKAEPTATPSAEPSLVPVPTRTKDRSPVIQRAPSQPIKTKSKSSPKKSSVVLPELLQGVEKKYAEAGTLTAKFFQTNESAALKKKTESSGTLEVKRPNLLRWEQKTPDSSLLVSNGQTFWFYTPPFDESEPGQVIVRKTSQVQSRLASSLLVGDFSNAPLQSVKQNTTSRFTLIPRAGSAGTVTRVDVQIDPDSKLILGVVLKHKDGNSSEIRLEEVKLGETLGADRFEFQIPKNTQILKE